MADLATVTSSPDVVIYIIHVKDENVTRRYRNTIDRIRTLTGVCHSIHADERESVRKMPPYHHGRRQKM